MANILLAGFDREAAVALSRKLAELGHSVDQQQDVDVILVSDDDVRCRGWLRSQPSSKPVVVVSRLGDEANWVAALEAGAADYCPADVDTQNLGWIVRNVLGKRYMTAAA